MPRKLSLTILILELALLGLSLLVLFLTYSYAEAQEIDLKSEFAIEDSQITDSYSEIYSLQADYLEKYGKYARITGNKIEITPTLISGVEQEIHEYITGKGEVGYQVFSYSKGYVKSQGFGPEASDRTYDWILIAD